MADAPGPTARDLGPAIGLSVAAGLVALRGHVGWALPLAALALALAHALVLSLGVRARSHRITHRVGHLATVLLTGAVTVVFWTLVVLPGAAVRRAFHGPARRRSEPAGRSRWRARAGDRPASSRRTFGAEAAGGDLAGATRRSLVLRGAAAVLVVQALLVGGVLVARSREPSATYGGSSSARTDESAALRDLPWVPEAMEESAAVSAGVVYTPFVGLSLRDHEGEHINVRNRVRRSHVADPATPGPALDVWFFGGSTMFGFDVQRDEHTIASEVVRLAEADGIEIRARNYGSTAQSIYQETSLLSLLLTAGERPDLVVFYDGINDFSLGLLNVIAGMNAPGEPTILSAQQIRRALVASGGVPGGTADPPVPLDPVDPLGPRLTTDEVVDAVVEPYAQGVELGRALGEAYDVPVLHSWQPDIYSRSPLDPGEEALLPGLGFDEFRYQVVAAVAARVRAALPAEVHDISDAYDDLDEPVLSDVVHTNEVGALAVAEALYPLIRSELVG